MDKNKIILLRWIGRFGNRMFQYAFGCAYAKKYNCTFYVPSVWEGDYIFKPNRYVKIITDDQLRLYVNQENIAYNYLDDYLKKALRNYNLSNNDQCQFITFNDLKYHGLTNIAFHDLNSMYYQHNYNLINDDIITDIFTFNDNVLNSKLYKTLSLNQNNYDVVHLRRGDIADKNYSGAHSCISKESYIQMIKTLNLSNIIWVSDDINERTSMPYHSFSGGQYWLFPMGEQLQEYIFFDFFPDFLIIYFARTIIRGNSAFSWWASTLSHSGSIYSPDIEAKPKGLENNYYLSHCHFIKGNHKHFMNFQYKNQFDDIIFQNCKRYNK